MTTAEVYQIRFRQTEAEYQHYTDAIIQPPIPEGVRENTLTGSRLLYLKNDDRCDGYKVRSYLEIRDDLARGTEVFKHRIKPTRETLAGGYDIFIYRDVRDTCYTEYWQIASETESDFFYPFNLCISRECARDNAKGNTPHGEKQLDSAVTSSYDNSTRETLSGKNLAAARSFIDNLLASHPDLLPFIYAREDAILTARNTQQSKGQGELAH
ncbi:MAG: hypothetical protein COV36_07225 [Alphaproteobacteria bacterium CG11_big_fil_rev_8_21_14_0_20_44_7]|nr:MAG: hypothetical protein COV36_07225 [Alphaproteobacteria bacterium CG11_big_fil_rev_8_21_14_0_20_44_7]